MNAKILLDTLRRRGVVLAVVGDELRYRPRRAVDETTLALLRQHKSALIELLAEEQRRGEAVRYDQGLAEGALPPPLGDRVAALLDKLHAHGCRVEALGDGQTFRSDCPSCRMAGALDLSEGTDGLPVIRSRCNCLDPLVGLDGLEAVPLSEFRRPKASPPQRPPKPKRPDAVCRCGSTRWRDVPIHGGRSIRRDCARCGRFLSFPLWYGQREEECHCHQNLDNSRKSEGFGDGDSDSDSNDTPQPAPSQPTPTYWPSWAQAFHDKLVRAGCHPKIVVARGNGGRPTPTVEATCPGCTWPGGLVAWPLTIGTMHAHCRAGCRPAEVFAGLEQRLKQQN
jgi:hypothetical protein